MARVTPPKPDPWPPPLYRKIGFFFGLAMAGYETVVFQGQHLTVYVLAFIFTGLPIARGVESAMRLLADIFGKK
jgi:hypothetical protein